MVEVGIESIVGDEQVGPAIIVVVVGGHGEILAFGLVDFGLDGYVREGSVAIIMVERVRAAPVNTGRTAALYTSQVAIPPVAQIDVAADVEIEPPVAIVIKKRRARMKCP